jgi:hypothetical protein
MMFKLRADFAGGFRAVNHPDGYKWLLIKSITG